MKPGRKKKRVGRPRLSKLRAEAPNVEDREVMTLEKLADYLQCSYKTARRLIQRRELPGFRLGGLGGHWRFLKSEVDDWIAKGGGL